MIYDGVVEKLYQRSNNGSSIAVYRSCRHFSPFATLGDVPCGICPVYKSCSIHGVISPSNCVYLQRWEQSLDF